MDDFDDDYDYSGSDDDDSDDPGFFDVYGGKKTLHLIFEFFTHSHL